MSAMIILDEWDDGVLVYSGFGEPACIFMTATFQGTRRSDGSAGDLDVVINDGGDEALRVPVSQVDELVEVLQRQKALALAGRARLTGGQAA